MGLFDCLDTVEELDDAPILRAPFGYVGSKTKSLKYILPELPYRNSYIEVFGGSGVVMLNRRKSKLDVYNDRFGGIVAFYRCVKDPEKLDKLCDWLELTVHSKEDYYDCRDTWKDCTDDVERAAKWYYSMAYSFGSKGNAWGRTVSSSGLAGIIRRKIPLFPAIHARLLSVQLENTSWQTMLKEYDNDQAVFYLDPPYLGTDRGGYKYGMTAHDHQDMLETIMKMDGYVAISGFANSLYDSYDWDRRLDWTVLCSMAGNASNEKNGKAHMDGLESYHQAEEILWIKE